ncbi:nephronectin isoform X2 [Pseudorasbora parva]|uniref:nephronectin isoform X2 n=1 Tax=Pseudorasbora parva TaxID=51549 RepID=UPI00351F1B02
MDAMLFFSLICVCAAAGSDTLRPQDGLCQAGWKQDCCLGWTRNSQGQCRPVCESGCKHGECVGPDQCRCHPGFTGKTCNQDARTCAMANCQYGCAVMKGEVRCQCPSPGLSLAPDRRTCVDVDECVTGQAKCARSRKCVNTFGSFVCRCHEGFELMHIGGKYQCADKKLSSFCHDKPGHKKCRCAPSANGKGYDCKSVVKVTIEPARPAKVTASPTSIYTATTPMTTTKEKNTTTAIFSMATTISDTKVTPTTVAMTTAESTTTTTTAIPTITTTVTTATTVPPSDADTKVTPTTIAMTTMESTTTTTTAIPTTTVTTATTVPTSKADTKVTPTTVAMTTAESTTTTTTAIPTVTTATAVPTSDADAKVTPPTVAMTTTESTTTTTLTTTTTSPTTTTLDNRVHRESTAKPRGDVHIPRYENNLFDWDFDIELGNTAEYVREDPAAGVVTCSFDEGLCFWMKDSEGDLKWDLKDDPAGGRYLSVPEATNRRSVKGARLSVPLATPTKPWQGGDLCLGFRHRLHGHHIGSLQVFVRKGRSHSPSIWTRTGGHGWRHAHITVGGRGLVDIVLKAERRRGKLGEIAVDEFSLRRGACTDRDRTE